jgi:hypothetical protein
MIYTLVDRYQKPRVSRGLPGDHPSLTVGQLPR